MMRGDEHVLRAWLERFLQALDQRQAEAMAPISLDADAQRDLIEDHARQMAAWLTQRDADRASSSPGGVTGG